MDCAFQKAMLPWRRLKYTSCGMIQSTDSLLVHDIDFLVTMDVERRVLTNAWLWIESGMIRGLGDGALPEGLAPGIERLSGKGRIVTPGLVNTHHHLYQNMAQAYTPGNNLPLLPWLAHMNKLWKPLSRGRLGVLHPTRARSAHAQWCDDNSRPPLCLSARRDGHD